jgi:hypothetical protein
MCCFCLHGKAPPVRVFPAIISPWRGESKYASTPFDTFRHIYYIGGGRGNRTYRRAVPATSDLRTSQGLCLDAGWLSFLENSLSMIHSLNISRAGNQRYPVIADFDKSPTTKARASLPKPIRGAPAPLWASKNPVLMSPVDPILIVGNHKALTASRSSVSPQLATLPGQEILLMLHGSGWRGSRAVVLHAR